MQITVQKGSKLVAEPVVVSGVAFVVFSDDEGNPVGVAEQIGKDVVQFTTCQEKDFALLLRRLGITATMPSVEVRRG